MRLEVAIEQKTFVNAAGERVDVLRDLAFTLDHGELVALVGPSGCGKTTMLRIVAGLDPDYRGRVVHAPNTRIGMVFQEPRLLPWRTIDDNVRLAAPQANEARLDALFEILELSAHRSHFPGELSLGLARRVALARAFAIEPNVLILDEPLVSLDNALSARLRDEIAALVERRPTTTLLVTHDLDDAVRLGDRILLLSPRPARIVAEIPILTPRAARNAAEIAAIKAEIVRHNQGGHDVCEAS